MFSVHVVNIQIHVNSYHSEYGNSIPPGHGLQTHPYSLQRFDFLVQATVDVIGVKQRISGNLAQQVPGKVADIVFAEIPLPQHSTGNHSLRVFMAALTEVTAEVFTVTQSLNIVCGEKAALTCRGKNLSLRRKRKCFFFFLDHWIYTRRKKV